MAYYGCIQKDLISDGSMHKLSDLLHGVGRMSLILAAIISSDCETRQRFEDEKCGAVMLKPKMLKYLRPSLGARCFLPSVHSSIEQHPLFFLFFYKLIFSEIGYCRTPLLIDYAQMPVRCPEGSRCASLLEATMDHDPSEAEGRET